jgi:uncharacterized protein YidB (DUF937 family)
VTGVLRLQKEEPMDQAFTNAVMTLVDQHGGVQGMLQKFQQGGLAGVASSWVQDGTPNQPVSPQDLHDTLGTDTLKTAAEENGLSLNEFVAQLSTHLPDLVSRLTSGGQVTQTTGSKLADLAMSFFRSRSS